MHKVQAKMCSEYVLSCVHHSISALGLHIHAGVAHLVERHLAKVEVAGSSPVARSKLKQSSLTIV